jgi:DNA polymerase (family 10)
VWTHAEIKEEGAGSVKRQDLALDFAERIATEVSASLASGCERIAVAGSIRRRKPVIHDIDLVAIPTFEQSPPRTLFGDCEQVSLLERELTRVASTGRVRIIERGTKAVRLEAIPEEIAIDLYVASAQTWAALLLIRTGSREHNIGLCSLARDLGMQLKADGSGLFRGSEMVARDSEESIFEALGLLYVPPERRETTQSFTRRRALR